MDHRFTDIQKQIAYLIQNTTPKELDQVDNIILIQFQGLEEELVKKNSPFMNNRPKPTNSKHGACKRKLKLNLPNMTVKTFD